MKGELCFFKKSYSVLESLRSIETFKDYKTELYY